MGPQEEGEPGTKELRTPTRVNVSMALVVLSLVAEVLLVALVGYGVYRLIELIR